MLLAVIPKSWPSLNQPKWTFMVYMDADNNLDPAGLDDINEMEIVGSTDNVNIVVLLDRWDEVYTSGSWSYYIQKGEDIS
jgi:hypothetical protein